MNAIEKGTCPACKGTGANVPGCCRTAQLATARPCRTCGGTGRTAHVRRVAKVFTTEVVALLVMLGVAVMEATA